MRLFPAVLVITALALVSCGKFRAEVTSGTTNQSVTVFDGSGAPVIRYTVNEGREKALVLADCTARWLGLFMGRGGKRPSDAAAGFNVVSNQSLYSVFYLVGHSCYPQMQNDLIRFGLIQKLWLEWSRSAPPPAEGFYPEVADGLRNRVRIGDFEKLFSQSGLSRDDMESVYPYMVSYLLHEILFVSVQEFMTRPYRYYNAREAESIFYQLVIAPETVTFLDHVLAQYGWDRVMGFAVKEYSRDEWKKHFEQEINETEKDYTAAIESRKFGGVFAGAVFRQKMDNILQLYNKTTKPTLFKK